jgi:hypothetical protein
MNTLLIKDLSTVAELDRDAARAVRGGMQTIKAPDNPVTCLKLPTMPAMPAPPSVLLPSLPAGGDCGPVRGPLTIHPD